MDFKIDLGKNNIPVVLKGHRLFIHRILLNLVGNALKFTTQRSITISCSAEELQDKNLILKIAVIDTGIGIPEDKREVIFDIFSRLTPSYQGTYKGSGLGLYIARLFLSAINGEIKVEGREGGGSTFICKIPVQVGTFDDLKNKLLELLNLLHCLFVLVHKRSSSMKEER